MARPQPRDFLADQLDHERQEVANILARSVTYGVRETPLAPTLRAALKRRGVSDERLTHCFVEAALRRAYPGNLLGQLYRVQFEDAINDAIETLKTLSLDECIALALKENTAEMRNFRLVPEPELSAAEPKLSAAPKMGTGPMDIRTLRRQLKALIPEAREPTAAEQASYTRSSAARGARSHVRTISSAPSAPPVAVLAVDESAMPAMPTDARAYLDSFVVNNKRITERLALLVYVTYLWPGAQKGRADDDAARIQQYVAAIWPSYAAARGLAP